MYYIIYIMTMPWASQHCLFNYTYMQRAINCNAKFVHPNTVGKIKTKAFLPFPGPGMDSNDTK